MFSYNDKRNALLYQTHVYRGVREVMLADKLTSVLDVGCGCPEKLRAYVFPVSNDITGIDILDEIDFEEYGMKYYREDLNVAKLDINRIFDLIVCADVIEHMRIPTSLLELIKRHSNERTKIVISTPDVSSYINVNPHPGHVQAWDGDTFKDFLEALGFVVSSLNLVREVIDATAYYNSIVCLCKLKEVN